MTCSIFIKSFEKDFGWLAYCLRSIHRFATGFEEIVVAIPEGSDLPLTRERIVKIKEPGPSATSIYDHGSGYAFQQVVKMNADKYCGRVDYICHLDSDTVFTKPVHAFDSIHGASPFFIGDRPIWLMTPFKDILPTDKNLQAHVESMTAFSGVTPEFEYMRRAGQVIPRWAYSAFRQYCLDRHGKTFEQYAMSQGFRGVSEFNFMGQFLHREYPHFIHFHDTRFGIPESYVRQFWSWGGFTDEVKSEL